MIKAETTRRVGHGRKFMIFSLASKRYAVPLSSVKEVIGVPEVTPLPNVPDYYTGMFNVRGQIISAVDLRIKLKTGDARVEGKKTCVVIFTIGDILVGVVVDEVIEVVTYSDDQIEKTAHGSGASSGSVSDDGITAVAREANGELALLIDLEKTFEKTPFRFRQEPAAA